MEETLDHAEWSAWQTFYGLFDLPDAYFLSAKFGAYMVGLDPWKVTAIYESDRPVTANRGIPEFVAFAKGYLANKGLNQPPPGRPARRSLPGP